MSLSTKPFRLRKAGGGSAVRGGDAIRDPRQTYLYQAAGGLVWGGVAGIDADFIYLASGGLAFGGAAVTAFAPAVAPVVPQAVTVPAGSGAHWISTVPVRRRRIPVQPNIYHYRAGAGGLVWGGAVATVFNPAPVNNYVYAPGVVIRGRFGGHAEVIVNRADETWLLLMAA